MPGWFGHIERGSGVVHRGAPEPFDEDFGVRPPAYAAGRVPADSDVTGRLKLSTVALNVLPVRMSVPPSASSATRVKKECNRAAKR